MYLMSDYATIQVKKEDEEKHGYKRISKKELSQYNLQIVPDEKGRKMAVGKNDYQWKNFELGTCYYPEHWDRSLWQDDLQRMLAVGIKTVRIAEFAWNKFEPEEGRFTFEFFDSFMEIAAKAGMKVIMGTPTATPPAWLTAKYPEVLNADKDGNLFYHGARRHYNYNSPKYRELCSRIVEKMAKHYGNHPSIVGWQIDNEINCELDEFYSDSDTRAFRSFLQKKYHTLEELNETWGTVFWNQTYTSWEEIYVPRRTVSDSTNPHEVLDYIRFVSDSALNFCNMQSQILRKYIRPGVFITTNGLFHNMDNHKMKRESLDVYTYDSYPNFAYLVDDPSDAKGLKDRNWSNKLAEVRSVCPHFGIMEQQSGANGWNTRMEAPAPKPGQMTLWTMQSIAHGADFVSFFRWRTCRMGTEMYWHGILDYDNRDNRKLAEISSINQLTRKISEIAGAEYVAEVGVLKDYSNLFDAKVDRWHGRLEKSSSMELFTGAQLSHTPIDYCYLLEDSSVEDLLKYKILFYPHPVILSPEKVKLLEEYVKQGGCLILGCRTGQKDETGKCPMTQMPGLARKLAGVGVTDFTLLGPADEKQTVDFNGKVMEAPVFNDILAADEDTKVLGVYGSNYYKGSPALTEHPYGKGKVLYFGAGFTRENMRVFLDYTETLSPWKHMIELPRECELAVRKKDGKNFFFVLNYLSYEVNIKLKCDFINMINGEYINGDVSLKPYGTLILSVGSNYLSR